MAGVSTPARIAAEAASSRATHAMTVPIAGAAVVRRVSTAKEPADSNSPRHASCRSTHKWTVDRRRMPHDAHPNHPLELPRQDQRKA